MPLLSEEAARPALRRCLDLAFDKDLLVDFSDLVDEGIRVIRERATRLVFLEDLRAGLRLQDVLLLLPQNVVGGRQEPPEATLSLGLVARAEVEYDNVPQAQNDL